jgi:DNA replication protein DnaC
MVVNTLIFKSLLATISAKDNSAPGDYISDDDLLMCGKCHTNKQSLQKFTFGSVDEIVKCPCACQCQRKRQEREESERRRIEFRRRHTGLTDREYEKWTFCKDDRRTPKISDACLKYVNEWEKMRDNNVGLIFYGGVGTGKTFYACCVANALIDNCVSVLVTNFPRILNQIRSASWNDDKNELVDRIQRFQLVVIDDLGVERTTEYAMEQLFNVIDTRYRSGKPLIVTTNLAPSDIKNPENISYARVYDRIIQNCLPVKMAGDSRRAEIAAEKRRKYQNLLGL